MTLPPDNSARLAAGRRLAGLSVMGSGALALLNVVVGLASQSTSVVAAGIEFAGDFVASLLVLVGISLAARPPDKNHPYGHGRFEILSGLMVGLILAAGGVAICVRSLEYVGTVHPPPGTAGLWSLGFSVALKTVLSITKFRFGSRIGSAALVADAWNDAVDILSGTAALAAVSLAILDPKRFLAADHYGGFAVGMIVVATGVRVVRDTSLDLTDVMPEPRKLQQIRTIALGTPGVAGIEKCFARKTGLQYHVDLHVEVNPDLSVRQGHEIATEVRIQLRESCDWIADVLVHIEPAPGVERPSDGQVRPG